MEFDEFNIILSEELKRIKINNQDEKSKKLYDFMCFLIEENKKLNLTAITKPKDIIMKHFIDSLIISKYIEKNNKIIDVGTGAGFPGIPISIYREDVSVTLLDSLNKRTQFLKRAGDSLNLKNIEIISSRAEDAGIDNNYREKYDIAVSRAVAQLNVLVEYLLPFVKVGGMCICMKGPRYKEEMVNINGVLNKLGGKLIDTIEIKNEEMNRTIILIKKESRTNSIYPRKAGTPSKKPLQ